MADETDDKRERIKERAEANVNTFAGDLRTRADKDYIAARMCYFHGLVENFLWDAQQCIEKYLKAMALFHGVDVRDQGHDLEKLFSKINRAVEMNSVDTYWPQKRPESWEFPFKEEGLSRSTSVKSQKTGKIVVVESFLKRISDVALVSRYCSSSYWIYGDELYKLDCAVFIVRRYCWPIGGVLGVPGRPLALKMKTCIDEGRDCSTQGYLGQVLHDNNHEYRSILTKDNLFLSEEEAEPIVRTVSVNHIISRRYEEASQGSIDRKLEFIEMCEKMLDCIYFNRKDKGELEGLVRDLYKEVIESLEKGPEQP